MVTKNASDAQFSVTLLLDPANNWFEDHLVRSGLLRDTPRYTIRAVHAADEVHDQDVVFILSYTKILPLDFLKRNSLNLVIHASDLPQGKGFAPVQWQILAGAEQIPVCLIEAVEKVDAGDIILRDQIVLQGHELYEDIRILQAEAVCRLVAEFLNIYPNFLRVPQSGSESFYRRRTAADGELDIDKSIREQFNLLRIGNNEGWPSFFVLNGQKYTLKIERAD